MMKVQELHFERQSLLPSKMWSQESAWGTWIEGGGGSSREIDPSLSGFHTVFQEKPAWDKDMDFWL